MGFFMDLVGQIFGASKVKPDYSAELEKVKKDYAELRVLMEDWRKLLLIESCQKRLEALNNVNYHPIALLIVAHPVKEFHDTIKYYIERLELAVQGDVKAIDYIEDTRNEKLLNMLKHYKERLQGKIQETVEKSEKVVDWPAIKAKILSDIESQENILRVYFPKKGEEKYKLEPFIRERLNALNSRSKSLPARLVWALVPGRIYIDKYLALLDQIIAADEESRKNLEVELKALEQEIDAFLTKEFFRIRQKYSYMNAIAA